MDLDILRGTGNKTSERIGHVTRMDHGGVAEKSKQEGMERMGRPRLRWLENVEKDLREMYVKICRQN
jgi:hypothetical protein